MPIFLENKYIRIRIANWHVRTAQIDDEIWRHISRNVFNVNKNATADQ